MQQQKCNPLVEHEEEEAFHCIVYKPGFKIRPNLVCIRRTMRRECLQLS